jgi:hypothetical protein
LVTVTWVVAATQAVVVAATPETRVEVVAALMLAKVAALRQEMAVRLPAVSLAAAAVILAAMVARQIEQEKPQNPLHENRLHEMPQKPPTPEWQQSKLPATKRPVMRKQHPIKQ